MRTFGRRRRRRSLEGELPPHPSIAIDAQNAHAQRDASHVLTLASQTRHASRSLLSLDPAARRCDERRGCSRDAHRRARLRRSRARLRAAWPPVSAGEQAGRVQLAARSLERSNARRSLQAGGTHRAGACWARERGCSAREMGAVHSLAWTLPFDSVSGV